MSTKGHAELRSRIEAGDLHFLDGLVLLGTIASQRWFGGKSRDVLDARVLDAVVAPGGPPILAFAIVEVRYGLQSHDLYHLPLAFRPTRDEWHEAVIAETEGWTVYDAIADPALVREIVSLMRSGTTLHFGDSRIVFWGANGLADRTGELSSIRPMGTEQSNSSVVIDDTVALKLYRRIEPGVNPELEILRFLTERDFPHVAVLEGYIAYEGRPLETTLALLQRYVPSHGDGWQLALDTIESDPNWLPAHASRLGEVTALLHNTLGFDATDPHFAPEEPSSEALSLLSASVDEEIEHVFTTLPNIEAVAPLAGRGEEVRDRLRLLTHIGSVGKVIRTHGDYHLAQALWTVDEDWLILDFEGEPARSVPERRRKRSPLRDVAGMLRSFAYAASASQLQRGVDPPAGWEENCRTNFLDGYITTADPALLPAGEQAIDRLLMVFELEKAVYELRYELDNRPDWVGIPVAGILRMLETDF
jgi:trehalose synthase-fused probable maltokinase